MEEKNLISQYGIEVEDLIRLTIAVKKANGFQNWIKDFAELRKKAEQEQTKKEISIEDFQTFSKNINIYIDAFEGAFLETEKNFTSPDAKEIKDIEKAIKKIRSTLVNSDSFKETEEDYKKQKDNFDEIKKQIIEWRSVPEDDTKKEERNQKVQDLIEKYGPALDAYKEAKKKYDNGKDELQKALEDINIEDLKNDLFKQLVIIEDNYKKLEFSHVNGINEALQALRGGIEMEIGMFGISLEDDSNTRAFDDFCKRSGIRCDVSKRIDKSNEEKDDEKEEKSTKEAEEVIDNNIKDNILNSAGLDPTKLIKTPVDDEQEEQEEPAPEQVANESEEELRNKILTGLNSPSEEITEKEEAPVKEPQPEVQQPEISEEDIRNNILSGLNSPSEEITEKEEAPVKEPQPEVQQSETREEEIRNNILEGIDQSNEEQNNNSPFDMPYIDGINKANAEESPVEQGNIISDELPDDLGVPSLEETKVFDPLDALDNSPELEESPTVSDALYEAPVEEPQLEEQPQENPPEEQTSIKDKIKNKVMDMKKSVSNSYLKAMMLGRAITGISRKNDKVAQAITEANIAVAVEKLGRKIHDNSQIDIDLYAKDEKKAPREQLEDMFVYIKDKCLAAYGLFRLNKKNTASASMNQENGNLDSNLQNQVTNSEGVVR